MRVVPVGAPGDRMRRIEMVAAIAFGEDPENPGRADRGWQARLARAMGVGKSTITSTLDREHSDVFDKKLADFITGLRVKMASDLNDLEILESTFRPLSREDIKYTDNKKDD